MATPVIWAAIWTLAGGAPVLATTLKARTDAEAVAAADRIVRGRVEQVRTDRRSGTGVIETIARIRVIDDYTGGSEPVIDVRELGGTIGNTTLTIPGAALFIVGDEVVALLEQSSGAWRPSAMGHSIYGVRETRAGLEMIRQGTGAHVIGDPGPARRSLAGFGALVREVRGRAPVRLSTPAAAMATAPGLPSAPPAYEAFRLLGQMRWHEPDLGIPVLWYRNTLTPAPLSSGTGDAELQTAMSAWTAPGEGALTLTLGGARSVAAGNLLNCGAPATPGGGLITFEDPANDITTAGVIAIGGACSTSSLSRTVNGTSFSGITYGFVIFTTKADMPQLANSLFFSRVAAHEVGHAIGLGHTQSDGSVPSGAANIMYPSCCQSATPVPPAIGPDDLAGLAHIYPAAAPDPCTAAVAPGTLSAPASGGTIGPFSVSIGGSCTWSVAAGAPWLGIEGPGTRTGPGTVRVSTHANTGTARTGGLMVAGVAVSVEQAAPLPQTMPLDTDGDGLPDAWEIAAGLNPQEATGANGAVGDPDGDGLTNQQEYQQRLHPRGLVQRYLAEGVQSDFFSTRIAIVNPSATTTAHVQLRFAGPADASGAVSTREHWLTLAPLRRATVEAGAVAGVSGSFATTVEANTLIAVDRVVHWDGTGYGSHAESATDAPRTTWYFAEGATGGSFNTFYLLLNPGASTAEVTITYLRAGRPPRTTAYQVAPGARVTVWVDKERWPDGDSLESAEVSARIDATRPIIAERAMYLDRGDQLFTAGHTSVGLAAPSTSWFLAEGATGDFFDLFILLANPSAQTADVRLRFLLGDGTVIEHGQPVPPFERATVWVDALGVDAHLIAHNPAYARLADAELSTEVVVDNGVGILVERSMWWPGDSSTWAEAHSSPGVTSAGLRWVLAEGEVGGPQQSRTYVLVANPSSSAATVSVTLLSESQAPETQTYTVPAQSRFNLPLGEPGFFPGAAGRRFGLLLESVGSNPMPIVVERAMYSGQPWAAGHNAVATRLP